MSASPHASEIRGLRVLELRRALGISGPELARRARISRDTLHRIERQLLPTGEPLVSTLRRIAAALELGALTDLYVIDGDGGLLGALARRKPPAAAEPRQLQSAEALAAAADRFAAVTSPLPEPERLLMAELLERIGPEGSPREVVRLIREWLIEHDGAGTVTLGRLRGLARTYLAAAAPDVASALEGLDAAITALRAEQHPAPAPAGNGHGRPRMLGGRGRSS
jgi:transcriptional regulator with XRE-family HTH domain